MQKRDHPNTRVFQQKLIKKIKFKKDRHGELTDEAKEAISYLKRILDKYGLYYGVYTELEKWTKM